MDYRYERPDGSGLWIREHAAPVRDAGGAVREWQGLLVDVTAERSAMEELQGSETRFRSLIEHLPAFVYAITDGEHFENIYSSPGGAGVLGYETDDETWQGLHWVDIVHPDDRDRVVEAWHRSVRTGTPFDERYRQQRADGGVIWAHDRAIRIDHPSGRPHWQGVVIDVTQEHQTTIELQASETRRRALIENLPAVVYEMAHDDDRRTLYISTGIEPMLGYTGAGVDSTSPTSGPSCCIPTTANESSQRTTSTRKPASPGRGSTG